MDAYHTLNWEISYVGAPTVQSIKLYYASLEPWSKSPLMLSEARQLQYNNAVFASELENSVNIQNAIGSLEKESQRFTEVVRGFDGGIWWSSDDASKIDVEAIQSQVAHIRIALDEITRLAKKIAE